jgi:hypothetical protein
MTAVRAPQRIQLRRTKGWRKPEGAVIVARPSKWGNPYSIREHGEIAAELYERDLKAGCVQTIWFKAGDDFMGITPEMVREELRGKDLACWCPLDGSPCHADVLLEIANA